MKNLFKSSLVLTIVVLFLIGCPTGGLKSLDEMTPQEKATWMLSIYNSQYDDYLRQASRVDLSDDERVILREKKKILMEVEPLIGLYVGYVDTGALPAVETETLIMQNIDRLLSM